MTHAVELECAAKTYGVKRQVVALDNVTAAFPYGTSTAILGPSGSGKSTLLLLAAGLLPPDRGRVTLLGRDTSATGESELSWLRLSSVGFVFQAFNLIGSLTCWQNVALPGVMAGDRIRTVKGRAVDLLGDVGIAHCADRYPDELSGGEMQRVAMARAIANSPTVLLADEPTGNLDSASAGDVLHLLRQLQRDAHFTLVLVTHDELTASICDRQLHLHDGRFVISS